MSIPKVKPSVPIYFFQQSVDAASIDMLSFVSPIIFFLYDFDCRSKRSWHGTDITLEYILSLANLWLTSIAKLTSEPVARIVKLIFLLVLKTSYAPKEHLFISEYFFLIGSRFCLVKDNTLGVF